MSQTVFDDKQPVFFETQKPTVPSSVTPDTPIESLNLNWRESDLPEKIRTKHVHRLHPYLGKYIPQLVEVFLRKYFLPGQTVLDPFCGSGTTLVQANELGINAVGYDISAFNVLLTKVKLTKYDVRKARTEIYDILKKTSLATKNTPDSQLPLWKEKTYNGRPKSNPYISKWFAPQAGKELLTYRDLILSENYEYQDLLKIILSRSARSARLVTHFDLDFPKAPQNTPYWCYKHSRTCEPTQEAYKFLERYSIDTAHRLGEFDKLRTSANWDVIHGDSRDAKFPAIDGVVTSPPYVGLIDYHRQHEYAYQLLALEDNSASEIGPASNGASQQAKIQYQQMLISVFKNIAKAIKPGGKVIVVAADKFNLYELIAESSGFETKSVIKRHVDRRTGRRFSKFYESIFIWQKG